MRLRCLELFAGAMHERLGRDDVGQQRELQARASLGRSLDEARVHQKASVIIRRDGERIGDGRRVSFARLERDVHRDARDP